jgi:hypothetical protein
MRSVLALALGILAGCGGVDAVSRCTVDGECPLHQLCDPGRAACVSGCLSDNECPGQVCSAHGRCVDAIDAGVDAIDVGDADQPRDFDLGVALDLFTPAPDLADVGDLGPCAGACIDSANEPNDKVAQATVLASSTMTLNNLALCPAGDVDFYKVTPAAMGKLMVDVTVGPCGPPVRIDLLGQDGASPVGTSMATATGWHAEDPVTVGKVRFIKISAAQAAGQNTYQLSVDVK